MKHFSTWSQRPSPQAPWHPSQKMLQIMAMRLDKVSSRLDQMAPQLCPFEISNFDVFHKHPFPTSFAQKDSPSEKWETPFTSCFCTKSPISHFSDGTYFVLSLGTRTKGQPPFICGGFWRRSPLRLLGLWGETLQACLPKSNASFAQW